jgi:hypothetical protein
MTRASGAGERTAPDNHAVMPGLVAGIHNFPETPARVGAKTWMAGTSPAMTRESDAGERTAPDPHAVMPALVADIHDVAGDVSAGGGRRRGWPGQARP